MEASALQAPRRIARISLSAGLLRLRSDDQLVAIYRAGGDAAFDAIHDRYRARLHAYCRQMLGGSGQDAEDALQDVFMRASTALRANGKPLSLRAWLYRVAHNRCIDHLRRPPAPCELVEEALGAAGDAFSEAERRDDLRRLVADVRRLPTQQRSALLMRELEGLPYSELASALEVSIPAVKSLLVRARVGLVQAAEARDTACVEIRTDLCEAHDEGQRVSGRARRHLRDCDGCSEYRAGLRSVHRSLGLLVPGGAGPLALLANFFGGGAVAGGTTASGGGAVVGGTAVGAASTSMAGGFVATTSTAIVSTGAAVTVTATKVAAVVASVVVTAGGAVEVKRTLDRPSAKSAPIARLEQSTPLLAPTEDPVPLEHGTGVNGAYPTPETADETATEGLVAEPTTPATSGVAFAPETPATGGVLAPDELDEPNPADDKQPSAPQDEGAQPAADGQPPPPTAESTPPQDPPPGERRRN